MSKTYELVNPIIAGDMKTTFNANSPLDAGKEFWDIMTKKEIINSVPKFAFTFRSGNELFHLCVKEKNDKNDKNKEMSYEIEDITEQVNKSLTDEQKKAFLKKVDAKLSEISEVTVKKLDGGRDSSSDSSSDYDIDSDSSDSDSSDSDSDSDYESALYHRSKRSRKLISMVRRNNVPIYYYWSAPSFYGIKTLYTPSFRVRPVVELWMPRIFYRTS